MNSLTIRALRAFLLHIWSCQLTLSFLRVSTPCLDVHKQHNGMLASEKFCLQQSMHALLPASMWISSGSRRGGCKISSWSNLRSVDPDHNLVLVLVLPAMLLGDTVATAANQKAAVLFAAEAFAKSQENKKKPLAYCDLLQAYLFLPGGLLKFSK